MINDQYDVIKWILIFLATVQIQVHIEATGISAIFRKDPLSTGEDWWSWFSVDAIFAFNYKLLSVKLVIIK